MNVIDVRPDHDDPESWSPSPENIFTIQEDASVVVVGGGFESWFRKTDFSPFHLFAVVDPLGPALIEDSQGPNPFVWLEPESFDLAGQGLADHLARSHPAAAQRFRERQARLSKRLADFEREGRKLASGLPPLFASRRGYEYAARSFGWDLEHLGVDPVRTPNPEEVEQWKLRRKEHPGSLILFDREPSKPVRAALASVGLRAVRFSLMTYLDPVDRSAGHGYFELYERGLRNLAEAAGSTP